MYCMTGLMMMWVIMWVILILENFEFFRLHLGLTYFNDTKCNFMFSVLAVVGCLPAVDF